MNCEWEWGGNLGGLRTVKKISKDFSESGKVKRLREIHCDC